MSGIVSYEHIIPTLLTISVIDSMDADNVRNMKHVDRSNLRMTGAMTQGCFRVAISDWDGRALHETSVVASEPSTMIHSSSSCCSP